MPTKSELKDAADAKKAFLKDPIAFALGNLLIPGFTNITARQTGGLTKFALVVSRDYQAKRFHGEVIPVYIISDGANYGKAAFDGYWCPYENNTIQTTTVWKKGNALFTDRMDGCTFGIGIAGQDGAVKVAHVNQQRFEKKGDRSMMEGAQRIQANFAVGGGGTIFEPSNYRIKPGERSKMSSTTFGVRDTKKNVWSFYAQLMESGGMGDYILRTVKKIK